MKAIVFDQFGDPAQVLHVRDVPVPSPGRGEVRVRMLASPINPSDLLYVKGQYGRRPQLPSSAGFEGVGVVEASGGGLLGWLRRGKRVAVLNGQGGNWQEQVIASARQVVPVPDFISNDHAATYFVNPASALVMTRYILRIPPGAWLLQTAAGSALARMVQRLARRFGFRTINVVRRREQAEDLKRAGETQVICSSDQSIEESVLEITRGAGVDFAIDAVGGATGSAAVRCLADHGRMLVYGTLDEEPLVIHPRVLMVGQKRVEGYWLSVWARQQRAMTMLRLFRQIGQLMREGILTTEVGATFPMDQIAEAARRAGQPGKVGKVILKLSEHV